MKLAVALVTLCIASGACAQQPAAPAAAKKTCTIEPAHDPTEADKALADGHFAQAEKLFAAMPSSDAQFTGQVRAIMAQNRLKEALSLATAASAAHPDDAVLMDLLGEVRFRRGEVDAAAETINRSVNLDFCHARTHYDMSRYLILNGLYASGQQQLEIAHKLAPHDPLIDNVWQRSHYTPPPVEQRISTLKEQIAAGGTDQEKADRQAEINYLEMRRKGDCQLVKDVQSTKVTMLPMGNVSANGAALGEELEVYFNGKRKRMVLDTGASGIVLTQSAVKALGLTAEIEGGIYGIGDNGTAKGFRSHIDSIRVGGMEFRNCIVDVYDSKGTHMDQDGLIGADVFRNFLVTLDFPVQEMRLSPLPKRPDEGTETASLGTEDEDESGPVSLAQSRKDRYVAPEMKDWTRVFRSGHDIIFPTAIGKAQRKLFIMDSGSESDLISPEAAREVTGVGEDDSVREFGVSGEVKNVQSTGRLYLQFGGVRRDVESLTSFDLSTLSRDAGVDIGGFIGFPTLKELSIAIDYRDNLVKLSYTPHVTTDATLH